jgi:hypothetical protein
MAIAPQTAMPRPAATTRPGAAPQPGATRHTVLLPAPAWRPGWIATRIAALVVATSVAIGAAGALTLALLTGTLQHLGG